MNMLALQQLRITAAKEEIRRCEDLNRLYGLSLSEKEITELVELREQALKKTGRMEFSGGIMPKLIRAFCKSPYVDSYNYATILGNLQEAFYYLKNEYGDRIPDDELIEFMEKVFNGHARGATEILTDISLEELCRWARNDFDNRYADEEAFW